MKHYKLYLFLFFLVLVFPLVSQESSPPTLPDGPESEETDPGVVRTKGDQVFSFNAGLFLPMFFSDTSWNFESGIDHLSLGGVGSLEWSTYLSSNITLGGQLSGMFAITPNKRTLTMIPFCARAGYIFYLHPFTIPVTLSAGFSFNKLGDLFEFTPILKPGVSLNWNINYDWAFGINFNYWWVPELHTGDLADQTRFGNFLETSFAATYHF